MKRISILLSLLVLPALACIISDIQDTVETLSKAAELLQEIDESGTWTYISEGTEQLSQSDGYVATVNATQGSVNATGDTITEVTETLLWEITQDADDDSMITVTRDGETRNYLMVDNESYILEDGQYRCLQGGDYDEDVFATGASEVFREYSATAIGVQLMSVAERDGDETINDFDTEKYNLVSKLQEAIDILAELPSDELRQELNQTGDFYVNGSLNIDKASRALIRFNAQYADLEKMEGTDFTFEVSQLGGIPDITKPDASQISEACPEPTAPTSTP
jgi:hypothetical protein